MRSTYEAAILRALCHEDNACEVVHPIASLLLNARALQDLKRRGVDTFGDLLPHAYEWLSPRRLAPGKPVMNVRLSIRRCLRILGVEIAFAEIRQRAIYCPCCAHTETDVMKIVALVSV